jgi:hypothetical protein
MNRTWQNRSGAAGCLNTKRPLTHSLDLSDEGLAMKAIRICSVAECDKPCRAKGYSDGPYSTDLKRYLPVCLRCHWQMDHVEAKAATS